MLFVGPCVIYIFIWRILPVFYTVDLSFSSWNLLKQQNPELIGLQNYIGALTDPRFYSSLKVTAILMIIATSLQLTLGLLLAVFFNRELFGKGVLRSILLIPMVLTPVVVGTIWYILFHDSIGPINFFLGLLGIKPINWLGNPISAFSAIIISDTWQWTPFVFILLLAALQVIDPVYYEAARIDGANGFQCFKHITIPLIRKSIIIAALLRSMDVFRIFDKIFVLTFGGPGTSTETVSLLVYKAAFKYFELGYSSALVIILLTILAGMYAVLGKLGRFGESLTT
jgi:multiple sugar transport system permease protein